MNRTELFENIKRKKSFLCVGLDTDINKIPEFLFDEDDAMFRFNKAIIDATADLCIAYKPNLAFYESMGLEGWDVLDRTVEYIRKNYPDQFIIADAKRGDIGNTSAMYARTFFGNMDFDSVTVAPYMGEDSVSPFLTYEGKWVTLLALTSNKGAYDFQFTEDKESGERLFEKVLKTSLKWGNKDNMMYVVGATKAEMLADNGEHDTYYTELRHEYNFLQNKFQLTPIDGSMWKFLRMRPDNFPTVRIAQFAALLHKSDHLFATLLGASDIEELQQIIDVNASEYWDTHYKFDTPSIKRTKHLGINAINTIIINVVVPFLFAYGLEHDMPPYQERAEILLDNIPYEKNSIISNWKETGINVKSAADSQALIHLHEYYCTDKRCLHCRVAKALTLSSR